MTFSPGSLRGPPITIWVAIWACWGSRSQTVTGGEKWRGCVVFASESTSAFSLTASPLWEPRGDEVEPSRLCAPLSAPPPPAAPPCQPITASPLAGRSIGARHLITAARWPSPNAGFCKLKVSWTRRRPAGPEMDDTSMVPHHAVRPMPALPDSDVVNMKWVLTRLSGPGVCIRAASRCSQLVCTQEASDTKKMRQWAAVRAAMWITSVILTAVGDLLISVHRDHVRGFLMVARSGLQGFRQWHFTERNYSTPTLL